MQPDNSRRRRPYYSYQTPGAVATVALAAAGTFYLANWAWNKWYGNDDNDEQDGERRQHKSTSSAMAPIDHPLFGGNNNNNRKQQQQRTPMNAQQWRSRRQRMVRCGDEVARALEGLLPSLKRVVEQATQTTKETQALKTLKTNGQGQRSKEAIELWETVKVRSMTRLVATAYAHSILVLVVTVQIHLLGGKLFEEQLEQQQSNTQDSSAGTGGFSNSDNDSAASDLMSSYGASHKIVLKHTYQYFLEHGVPALIRSVEAAVRKALQDWKFSDASCLSISRESFGDALRRIRNLLEKEEGPHHHHRSSRQSPPSLLQYLVPSPSNNNHNLITDTVTDEMARWILYETWDILESPVVTIAHLDCLDLTFSRMRNAYWAKIFDNPLLGVDDTDATTTRPLAQVISKLKHTSRSFFEFQQLAPDEAAAPLCNSYYLELQCLASVMELADVSFG